MEEVVLMKENPHPFMVKILDDYADVAGHICLV